MSTSAMCGRYTQSIRAQGVIHPNGPLAQQPWGLEFAVLDVDGNLYKFCGPADVD